MSTDPRTGLASTKDNVLRRTLLAPDHTFQSWVWSHEAADNAARRPSGLSDGVDLLESQVALVGVYLRKKPDVRSTWLRVDVCSSGQTYGLTANGASIGGVAGAADAPATAALIKAEFEGESNFTAINGVATQLSEDDGLDHIVRVDLGVHVEVLIGSGQAKDEYATVVNEASTCLWRVWGLLKGLDTWVIASDAFASSRPMETREVDCSPYKRIFVEVIAADGAVLPFAGGGRVPGTIATSWEAAKTKLTQLVSQDFFAWPAGEALEGTTYPTLDAPHGEAGPRIHKQVRLAVPTSPGTLQLLSPCAKRTGFVIINDGDAEIRTRWLTPSGAVAASATDRKIPSGNFHYEAGDVPNYGMVAIAIGDDPGSVWVEERR